MNSKQKFYIVVIILLFSALGLPLDQVCNAAKPKNIGSVNANDLLGNIEAVNNIEKQSKGVVSAEKNLPVLDYNQQIKLDLFNQNIDEKTKYPQITKFYNDTINAPYIADEFTEMRKKLADNKIVSLGDLIALYENKILSYDGKTEEEKIKNFLEEIKRCNL